MARNQHYVVVEQVLESFGLRKFHLIKDSTKDSDCIRCKWIIWGKDDIEIVRLYEAEILAELKTLFPEGKPRLTKGFYDERRFARMRNEGIRVNIPKTTMI